MIDTARRMGAKRMGAKGTGKIREDGHSETVLRAASLMDCFTEQQPEWSIMDLTKRIGLNQSSVSRLVATLENVGYLQRDANSGKVRLGLRLASMGFVALNQLEVRRTCLPFMEVLANATHLNVTLAVLAHGRLIYVARTEAPALYMGNYVLAREVPLHCTALGKVFLANMPDDSIRHLVGNNLLAYTPSTVRTTDELMTQLEVVRTQGYAVDLGEWIFNVGCIATPVLDHSGSIAAAISAGGPKETFLAMNQDQLRRQIVDAATKMSFSLGYWRSYA